MVYQIEVLITPESCARFGDVQQRSIGEIHRSGRPLFRVLRYEPQRGSFSQGFRVTEISKDLSKSRNGYTTSSAAVFKASNSVEKGGSEIVPRLGNLTEENPKIPRRS